MAMITRLVAIAAGASVLTCASPNPPAGPVATPAGSTPSIQEAAPTVEPAVPLGEAEPLAGVAAPVVATWEVVRGVQQGATGTLALRLRVERLTEWPLPIKIQVVVPAGVRVLHGETQLELAASQEPGVTYLDYDLVVDSPPQDDLVGIVDSQGTSGGVHAEPRYGFGRPESATPGVDRAGPSAQVGGHNLGPGVLLE